RAGPGVDADALTSKVCQRRDPARLSDEQGLGSIQVGNGEIDDPVAGAIVADGGDQEIQPLLLQQLDAVRRFNRLELELDAEPLCDVRDQVDLEALEISLFIDEAEVRRIVFDASAQNASGLDLLNHRLVLRHDAWRRNACQSSAQQQ